ncbi:MAG TPA: enoyl-CoA hydratase/isomerase family protein [Burkholderiales bacterium]|nr:enoyl-CoA hydratase/isomerase family protein [Burkholderiales bacterium]
MPDHSSATTSEDDKAASILVRRAAGVVTLVLNRPGRGNALSSETVECLHDAVTECIACNDVHTLVLRAQGANFCTGFDWTGSEHASDGDLLLRLVRIELLLQTLWSAPIRTVALVHGRTWGAGADLMVACDMRVALPGATFRFPGAGFGLVLGTRRLAERMGADQARRTVLEGRELDAAAARELNLLTDITEAFDELVAALPSPAVDRDTMAAIAAATRPQGGDADLANLVRSAARPGLGARLRAYAQRAAAHRSRRAAN